jgi:hypothetical protein
VVNKDLGREQLVEGILIADVDGDGTDELIASVWDAGERRASIVRYDEKPLGVGVAIAGLNELRCRSLASGDIDGDGSKEIVATESEGGVWLLRHVGELGFDWSLELIDPEPGGAGHAAVFADLDEDGADELYVANDAANQINQYVWLDGDMAKTTIYSHSGEDQPRVTLSLAPVPAQLALEKVFEQLFDIE